MVSSTGLLIGIGAAIACGLMVLLWLVQVRIKDASHVDVGWAGGLAILAVVFAVIGNGDIGHRVLVAVLGPSAGNWQKLAVKVILRLLFTKDLVNDGHHLLPMVMRLAHHQLRIVM